MDYSKDDEVKNQIVEAAKRVFQRWGFIKSTMEDIARESGKGKSTLYYYFKSKEEIIDVVLNLEFTRIISEARNKTAGIQSAKEKLKSYFIMTLTTFKEQVLLYSIVREEIRGNRQFIDKIKNRMMAEEEVFIKSILHEGLITKEFSFVDEKELNIAAKAITGIISAMELYLFLENEDLEQIDVAAKFIANGI